MNIEDTKVWTEFGKMDFLMKKTLGAPDALKFLEEELYKFTDTHYDTVMLAETYKKMIQTILHTYLKKCKMMYVDLDLKAVYCHGGLNEGNWKMIPNKSTLTIAHFQDDTTDKSVCYDRDPDIDYKKYDYMSIKAWEQNLCAWAQGEIDMAYTRMGHGYKYYPTEFFKYQEPPLKEDGTNLDSSKFNHCSVLHNRYDFNAGRILMSNDDKTLLMIEGVNKIVCGHSPCGYVPLVETTVLKNLGNFFIVRCDNSRLLSDTLPVQKDTTKKNSGSGLELEYAPHEMKPFEWIESKIELKVSEESFLLKCKVELENKQVVEVVASTMMENMQTGTKFLVGKVTKTDEYVGVDIKGFTVTYNILN
jgi:hypothetical protein